MRILFLDLASNASAGLSTGPRTPGQGACIACVSDGKTESIRFIDHRIGDDGLMPMIDAVMKEAGWVDRDLTHIACVTGPGGFTSLRMAVTLANTYADQLRIPVAGIHLSDLYEARTSPSLNPSPEGRGAIECPPLSPVGGKGSGDRGRIWMHSTKKTQVFARSFGGGPWPEPTLLSIDELIVQMPDNASVIGEILPEHRQAISSMHPVYPDIRSIPDILPAFLAKLAYSDRSLVPWYGRGW